MSDPIEHARRAIEALDERLVTLLAERIRLTGALGREKSRRGVAIEDERRERELRALHEAAARREGVGPDLVREVFETILAISKREQAERSGPGAP